MKRKVIFWTSLGVLIAAVLAVAVYFLFPYLAAPKPMPLVEQETSSEINREPLPELPDNPIDFATLQAENSDIYAWIRVPGTNVDYPVLQSSNSNDDFYLHRNIKKQYEFAGSIYSQQFNTKTFKDPNTVLYGHNMLNGSMFASLHKFRDPAFFNENRYIYIYTPGHILTYDIFAAYRFDNRHLLLCFNLRDPDVFADYLKMIRNPDSTIVNEREGITLDASSRLLTLNTCITSDDYRYLVQGVLISDQPTK